MNPVFLPPGFADSHAAYMVGNRIMGTVLNGLRKVQVDIISHLVIVYACADPPGKSDLKKGSEVVVLKPDTVFEK